MINEADLFKMYRDDPVFFVEHALGHYTWSKQREVLRSIRDNERTAVKACHGISKTFTASECVVWFLNCYDGIVITTAPTWSQVENLLWKEIRTIYANSKTKLKGECMTTKIRTNNPENFAIGFSTNDPSRAEGFHAKYVMVVFDEAKGIPQWMWDSIKGYSTGCKMFRFLAISTTDGVSTGEQFYKIFMDEKQHSLWHTVSLSAYDSPNLTGEHFKKWDYEKDTRIDIKPQNAGIPIADDKWIKKCEVDFDGVDSLLYKTKVLGMILDNSENGIILLSDVRKMFEREVKDEGQIIIGVDVARYGADRTVFYKRKGLKILSKKVITKQSIDIIVDELELFADKNKEVIFNIDDTGLGGGVTDFMKRKGYKKVNGVNFQSSARDKDKYPNIISEIWFTGTEMIKEVSCDKDDDLERELINRKYQLNHRGQRVVESKEDYKKRGFRSPDFADSFLLCLYTPKTINFSNNSDIWL